jgi:hypothetical protein
MLQAHSILWSYLWIAPNVLLLSLALLTIRRLHKQFPVFLVFALAMGLEQLLLYIAEITPSVSPATWWKMFWVGLLIEAVLKFAVIGELFSRLLGLYSSLAKSGKMLISGLGVILAFVAAMFAAYTPKDHINWILSGAHLLEQTTYLIECGLIVFLLVFAAYFKLTWNRSAFGIALGLGVSSCLHLACWAMLANGNLAPRYRVVLDFVRMAAYHVCVLIWFYYLLVPQRSSITPALPPPEHSLELWNRELERLLQQ